MTLPFLLGQEIPLAVTVQLAANPARESADATISLRASGIFIVPEDDPSNLFGANQSGQFFAIGYVFTCKDRKVNEIKTIAFANTLKRADIKVIVSLTTGTQGCHHSFSMAFPGMN